MIEPEAPSHFRPDTSGSSCYPGQAKTVTRLATPQLNILIDFPITAACRCEQQTFDDTEVFHCCAPSILIDF
jgi:hypothetical protein